jgi:hypothetical protein
MELYDMAVSVRSSVAVDMQCEWAMKEWVKLEAEDMKLELTQRV